MVARHPGAVLPDPSTAFGGADGRRDPPTSIEPGETAAASSDVAQLTLADIYREHFPFVWRLARRLGVPDAQLEDAVQDVFIVVFRRLADFEGRSSVRTWLAAIVRRVVSDYRRTVVRKPAFAPADAGGVGEVERLSAGEASPEENVMANEAARILAELLEQLDDDKREVFVLAELEQWSLAEIAAATGVGANTVSSRLRLAREAFEQAAERLRARDGWRFR